MAAETLVESVDATMKPVVEGMGYRVVELSAVQTKKNFQVHLVIHRKGGVTIEDCAIVSKTVLPRLQVTLATIDVQLEVSSPGTERRIRGEHEYEIFKGRGVRIMRKNENDWLAGIIADCDGQGVHLSLPDRTVLIPYGEIKKARLDDAREVG
jgi:ribosome maturation factor RimP